MLPPNLERPVSKRWPFGSIGDTVDLSNGRIPIRAKELGMAARSRLPHFHEQAVESDLT